MEFWLSLPSWQVRAGTRGTGCSCGFACGDAICQVGAVQGLFKKIVRYRAAIWIAISIPSARYGVHLSGVLPATWLSIAFSLIMLIVAYRVFANQVDDFIIHHVGLIPLLAA